MKEQTEKIFRAIGDVGDDLIERADRPVRKHAQVWVKWAALAACCALVIGAAAFIVPMFHAGSTAPETTSLSVDAAPAETELAAQEMETAEAAPEEAGDEPMSIRKANDDLIEKCLAKHGGKVKPAAAELGISERTIYRKLAEKKNGK